MPLGEITFDCAGVNHTAWFTTFRRGDEDLLPKIREVMTARHVTGTMPMLPRSGDPYESNERVRAELMRLTGYFHTESSHHASEYWAWFRKTPELTRSYLDRHWDNLEASRAADKGESWPPKRPGCRSSKVPTRAPDPSPRHTVGGDPAAIPPPPDAMTER